MALHSATARKRTSAASAGGDVPTAAATSSLSPPASAAARKRHGYPPQPPALLTEDMILFYFVPVSHRTLDRWIAAGEFPAADVKKGRKVRFWRRETVEQWVAEQAGKQVA